MCWACDAATKSFIAESYRDGLMSVSFNHSGSPFAFAGAAFDGSLAVFDGKYTDAFAQDGVGGDLKTTSSDTLLVVTADDIPDSTATDRTITVDGAHIVSTIDTLGDQDFFAVQLEAGHIYDIGQFLVQGGPSGVPLSDAYIEIYDSNGNLITSADGGGPNTPSGLDALLTFIPDASGTYYINARAYDSDSTNGTTGDAVGDYELFVNDVSARPSYVPYYDLDSPLHSIDWGSQVDRTSRNPDGEEGPRITDNAFTGVGSNPYGIEGKNVITVYFAKAGDVFLSEDPANPGLTTTIVAKGLEAWELQAFTYALDLFEQVADVVFVIVDNRAEADFKVITYNGTPGVGASLLGRMSPPNELNEGQAEFNSGDARWSEEGVSPGGFYFSTLLHEFGHGMGLAHPHDNGGRSSIMRGAGGGTAGIGGGLGDFNLSQQVHTVMSYNDGWATSPYGQPRSGGITGAQVDHFGWVASLSPLDIAAIQDKYGVNEEWATGNDTYTLKDVNAAGTSYTSIWDGGGVDEIVYDGARDASIDLRPATLAYEEGGGGRVSYAFGIHGGFTIANAVTIENARSGSGNDTLVGNDASNSLSSGAGNDTLVGGAGNDSLDGGLGTDTMTGGDGSDTFRFDSVEDSTPGAGRDVITDFTSGSDLIDLQQLGATTFVGTAQFSGNAGEVRYVVDGGSTLVELDNNGDGAADVQVELAGTLALGVADFASLVAAPTAGDDTIRGTSRDDVIRGLGGNDTLIGLAGADVLLGDDGNDRLVGGSGADVLNGGSGSDLFVYEAAADSPSGVGHDIIQDFRSGVDDIDLTALGDLTFIGKKAFSGNEGELHVVSGNGFLMIEADLDGDAVADFQIELSGVTKIYQTDFLIG